MKILVTGGAGYIGSHVVKLLGEDEKGSHEIVVADNLSTGFEKNILYGRLVRIELSDHTEVEKLFESEKFDAVIHFAASIVVPESVENPIKYYMNNTINSANIIKCAVKTGVKYFVFSSTAAVYGENESGIVDETSKTAPINPYGWSKLMTEKILKDCAERAGMKYTIFRYFNVAGADVTGRIGQCFPNATHLIKVATQTALGKRKCISVFGTDYGTFDGTGIRDYIHVDDLAAAHIDAVYYMGKTGISDIYNCGYGKGYSVLQVIKTVKEISGVDFTVKFTERRPGDPGKLVSDNKKIVNKMGWKPKYDDLSLICRTALEWEKTLD